MVSDVEGETVHFSVASNTGSSTALKTTSAWQETFSEITLSDGGAIKCGRLDNALDAKVPMEERDALRFMVLDIEGSELKALRSLGNYFDRLDFALIEISVRQNYEDGPLLVDIDDCMAMAGFERVYMKLSASSGDALYKRVGPLSALARQRMRLSASIWQTAATLRLTDLAMTTRKCVKRIVDR
jgi:hypothetical protein